MLTWLPSTITTSIRLPAVAGSFYPDEPGVLVGLVDTLLAEADRLTPGGVPEAQGAAGSLAGLLVPHAGLAYSGIVAAAAWRLVGRRSSDDPLTVVMLGTNHGAGWLRGVGAWEAGAWRTPLGDVAIDVEVAERILGLGPPFHVDREAHHREHSLEVQLPILQAVGPGIRIVPLSVSAGTGDAAIAAGHRLGELLARLRETAGPIVLAISSDMAHYPSSGDCRRLTADLLPPILRADPVAVARTERAQTIRGGRGVVCGMCGIEPTVLGMAALRAAGASHGRLLASATSADAGGPTVRTVGYVAVAFTG
jgi:AmmeMemoRadiSam system protein B